MNENSALPAYGRFDQALESIALDMGASEVHGVICGLLSTGSTQAHVEWIEAMFMDRPSDDLLVREARRMLGQLYHASRHQLSGESLDFVLMLPEDETPLQDRARALIAWCEGFLYGLGLADISEQQFDGDAREALSDIAEFTRLDLASLEEDEASESAYMELQEFTRVATLLIRETLAATRERDDAGE